jgi:mercuric ion binding protein
LKRITRRLASKVCPLALLIASSAIAAESQAAVLEVQNMTCSLCPETVKKARQKVPGDEDAKVDLDHKTATVKFNPAKAKIAVLAKATTVSTRRTHLDREG